MAKAYLLQRRQKRREKSKKDKKRIEKADKIKKEKKLPETISAEADLSRLKQDAKHSNFDVIRKETKWDLEAYAFPGICKEGGQLEEEHKQAIANIRVAMYKKIESLKSVEEIDKALDNEFLKMPWNGASLWVLGKTIPYNTYMPSGHLSLRRELHGYNRMLQLIRNVEEFDPMELLGLYLSDVMFLQKAIEVKYGKEYIGVLGWEISQITGITAKKKDYDPKTLPIQIQVKLQILDEITQKIIRSGINDIPASLRRKNLLNFSGKKTDETLVEHVNY